MKNKELDVFCSCSLLHPFTKAQLFQDYPQSRNKAALAAKSVSC